MKHKFLPLNFWDVTFILVILAFACVLTHSQSIETLQMNKDVLATLKAINGYDHSFIFFDQELLDSLQPDLAQFSAQPDVKFYFNNCGNNQMQECNQDGKSVPILLLFNKIFIRYNGNPQNKTQIISWMQQRIMKVPIIVSSVGQLSQQLQSTPDMFCFCKHNPNQRSTMAVAENSLFYALAKAFMFPSTYNFYPTFIDFCLIDDSQTMTQLGLKEGNITYVKGAVDNRVEYEYKNSYNMWESFVKMNLMSHLNNTNTLMRKRFEHANKQEKVFIVVCDFSFQCEKFWKDFDVWSRTFIKENKEIDLRPTFYDLKQHSMFVIYLNVLLKPEKFPALIYASIFSNNSLAGYYERYLIYPQVLNGNSILQMKNQIQKGQIKPQFLSDKPQKNNGYFGKNSEKLIQKLTTSSLNQTIQQSEKHYVLLLTVFDVGCKECQVLFLTYKHFQEFYKQYKKVASFFEDHDISFGVLNLMKNQVQIDQVQNIPELLLYNKYHKNDPVRMKQRHSFDGVFGFLENNSLFTAGQL